MKSKLFFALLSVGTACLLLLLTVCADSIVIPDKNGFFNEHIAECTYVGRVYTVKDGTGSVTVYSAPDGKERLGTYPNGAQLEISHTYTAADNSLWGVCVLADNAGHWMRMSSLEVIYDYISFAEEHAADIKAYDAAKYPAPASGEVRLRKYPGSPVVVGSLTDVSGLNLGSMIINQYVAPDGQAWGFAGSVYDNSGTYKNVWLCLDTSVPVAADTAIQTEPVTVSPDSAFVADEKNTDLLWYIPVIIAVVLAGGAGIMIGIFYEKKRAAEDSGEK